MNVLVTFFMAAVLCVGSFFFGGYTESQRLEEIKALIHQETQRALAESKQESQRVEKEFHDKLDKLQVQWDRQVNPLLNSSKEKCKGSKGNSSACMKANNAVLEALFNLKQEQKAVLNK